MDEENLFSSDYPSAPFRKFTSAEADETFSMTDLSSDNINKERIFKLKVLEWLNNGEPKLFRSATEGNYIVRLMNTSLTPSD